MCAYKHLQYLYSLYMSCIDYINIITCTYMSTLADPDLQLDRSQV